MNKKGSIKKKLSKNMFLLDVETDKPNMGFFRAVFKFKIEKELYKYDKGKLIFYKNLAKLYKNESIKDICQISENEYV